MDPTNISVCLWWQFITYILHQILTPFHTLPRTQFPLEATDNQPYLQVIKHKHIHKLRKLDTYEAWTMNYVYSYIYISGHTHNESWISWHAAYYRIVKIRSRYLAFQSIRMVFFCWGSYPTWFSVYVTVLRFVESLLRTTSSPCDLFTCLQHCLLLLNPFLR